MHRRLTLAGLLCLALAAAACREAPRQDAPGAARRAVCRELFTQAAGGMHLVMRNLPELRRDQIRAYRRGGMRECLSRLPDMPGACLETEVPAQLLQDMEAAVELCAGWDEALLRCFRTGDLGPACARAYDHMRGLSTAGEAPAGPDARWHVQLPAPVQAVHLLADGGVLAVAAGQVSLQRDGRQRWAADLPGGGLGWLLAAEPEGVLVGDREGQVTLLDLDSGGPRWRRELPFRAPPRPAPEALAALPPELRQAGARIAVGPEEVPRPLALAGARDGAQLLVGLSDGRVLRLDLEVCAQRAAGCFRDPERMFVEELGTFQAWLPLTEGRRLVYDAQELVGIERTGEQLFRIRLRAYDRLGPPTPLADGTFTLAGLHDIDAGRVLALDPSRCRSEEPLALPPPRAERQAHAGHAHQEDFPEGCLAWELELSELAALPPAELGAGEGVLVLDANDGLVVRVSRGEVVWRARLGALALAGGEPGRAYALTGTPALVALDSRDGRPVWRSPLAYAERPTFTEVWPSLTLRDRWLLVADGPHLSLFELPAAGGTGP